MQFRLLPMGIKELCLVQVKNALAFTLIKTVGAIYLIYLGMKMWRNGINQTAINSINAGKSTSEECSTMNLYGQGVVIALTNPKAIIFTTALFPQFVVVSEPLVPQFSILVVSFMLLSFGCLSCYSLIARQMKARGRTAASGNTLGKISGSLFIGTGCFMLSQSK